MDKILFALIIAFIIFEFIFNRLLDTLNKRGWELQLPASLQNLYDKEKYEKAKAYDLEKDKLSLISAFFSTSITILFLLFGGFAMLDQYVRSFAQHKILISLLYFGILGFASSMLSLPFSIYGTFRI